MTFVAVAMAVRGIAIALVALVVVASPQAASPSAAAGRGDDAVTRWLAIELDEVASHRTNPPRAARGLALLSVAMLEASSSQPRHRSATVTVPRLPSSATCIRIAPRPSTSSPNASARASRSHSAGRSAP